MSQGNLFDPPVGRFVRRDDPSTSLLAAIRAAKASQRAVKAVQCVMEDGAPRSDQEIWIACRTAGYISSLNTVQHGRLALSAAGLLEDTGERRPTADGMPSRVWRLVVNPADLNKEGR